ncbi:hypothetical protein HMPREF6123_1208 [Oribacterium sinus F0268]|uniref:Uncharacterized protein n=1 Tax=Oribacterium sinus F0268 TaxID=585501 RepID=C2KXI9_9FIRM|nr:hypothetical protein HMPREF6123_1208 [Oribacterium sinus F0268]
MERKLITTENNSPDSFSSTGKSNFYVVKDSWLVKNFTEVFGILGEKQYYDRE